MAKNPPFKQLARLKQTISAVKLEPGRGLDYEYSPEGGKDAITVSAGTVGDVLSINFKEEIASAEMPEGIVQGIPWKLLENPIQSPRKKRIP